MNSIIRAIREAVKRKKPVASQEEGMLRQLENANAVLGLVRSPEWPRYQQRLEARLGRIMHEVFKDVANGAANREALFCKVAAAGEIYALLLEPDEAAGIIEAAKQKTTKPKA